jgi:hypothetical protein
VPKLPHISGAEALQHSIGSDLLPYGNEEVMSFCGATTEVVLCLSTEN